MASVSTETLKCGYLTTVSEKKAPILSLKKKQKIGKNYWKLRSQPTRLESYSNERDAKPKEEIQLVDTQVYKHRSDNTILCINQPGSEVRFLRAESREHCDEWCEAIISVIRQLRGQHPEHRCRVNTDISDKRLRPKVGRTTQSSVQSSAPTLEESFVENLVAQRPLPAVPVAETEDGGISKLRETPFCCNRKHVVGFNKKGTNLADTEVVYENVHYVRSMDEWVKDVERRKENLVTENNIYTGFRELNTLRNNHQVKRPTLPSSAVVNQDDSEPVYELRLPTLREPEENDERMSMHHSAEGENPNLTPQELLPINNLSKPLPWNCQQPAHPSSLNPVNIPLRPNSMESTEDNTDQPELPMDQKPCPERPQRQKPQPAPRRRQKPPPELLLRQKPRPEPPQRPKPRQKPLQRQEPMSRGELLKKIQTLRDEQRKPHGITLTIKKSSLVGNKIRLMEMKDGIWVTGWDPSETSLGRVLKVGDQIIKINRQALTSASFAQDIICSTDDDEVTIVLKRLPRASVCLIQRRTPRDDLGITLEGNEIIELHECGLVSKYGMLKPQTTGVSGHMCNWAITEVNMTPLNLFVSEDSIYKTLRSGTLNELVLTVQPVDFIQMIRENLLGKV